MIVALTFTSALLGLHLLSAFALAGSIVLFWYLIVAGRNVDTPGPTVAMGPLAGVATKVVRAGAAGTLVFGIWLAIRLDHVKVWSGWIIAAIVLLVIAAAAGSRSGAEYERAMKKAEELEAAGQTGSSAELLALNRTSRGLWLHAIATVAVFLLLVDMIWKPGASEIVGVFPRAKDFNISFPLLVHITGAMILVGGMLGGAAALLLARSDERKVKVGYYSLLFVALPGLILTKIGATAIWAKESPHSLIGAAFPHSNDPRWVEVGGTALDGGAVLLVGALIIGWFGVRRMGGAENDLLTKIPLVKKLSGKTLIKLTTLISVVLLVGYAAAIWAMSTKPS
jgi:hypothetical protein